MSGLPPGISPVPPRPTAPRAVPTPVKTPTPIGPAVVTNYYGTHPNVFLYLIIGFLSLVLAGFVVNDLASWHHDRDPIPSPTPEPRPEPKPKGELRVILVSDSAENMSKGQLDVLSSTAVRAYLNAHCGKDTDGRPAWRSWPIDVNPKGESDIWQKAWEATKATLGPLPQVVIFHGTKGEALPMPDTEDALIELLKNHGGK